MADRRNGAGTPCGRPDHRMEFRGIARQLRAAATAVANVPVDAAFAEHRLAEGKQAVEVALQDLTRALDRVRIELSEEKLRAVATRANAGRDSYRPPPAVSVSEEVLEWLAFGQLYVPRSRYTIRERGGSDDHYVRARGAVAELTGGTGRGSRSLLLGGEIGIQLLRGWPRSSNGALTFLGPVGVARVVAGRHGEQQILARAEDLRRVHEKEREREGLLKSVAEVVLGEDRAREWMTYERVRRVESSEEELGEVLDELGAAAGIPDARNVRRRLSLVNDLIQMIDGGARNSFHPSFSEARRAALHSGAALRALLARWSEDDPGIPFRAGALERALQAAEVTESPITTGKC